MDRPARSATTDVAIIGAGLSGLVAARALHRRGVAVQVIEARDRVGGKLWAPAIDGVRSDLGAHWVGHRHQRVRALAGELGLEIERQHLAGRHVFDFGGVRRESRGETPLRPVLGVLETAVRVLALERLVRRIDPAAPWASKDAARLDAMSVADWMGRFRTDFPRAALTAGLRTTIGFEPEEVSMLAFLSMAGTSGGLAPLLRFRRGAQDSHLLGGAAQLAEGLAEQVGAAPLLDTPVLRVEHGDFGVRVEHASGRVEARALIGALSPATAAAISFDPPLPFARQAVQNGMPLGAYSKTIVTYASPWWRAAGRSGVAISDRGAVQMAVDVGPARGGPGMLAAFVTGAAARRLAQAEPAVRRAEILADLTHLLGPDAAHPRQFEELQWGTEPWSLGAPVGVTAPGVLTTFGAAIRAPVGPIHWAGTEAALAYSGYMEGAIAAGEHAADAILAQLGPR